MSGTDVASEYEQLRQRVVALLTATDDRSARAPVPACPGWSVKDLVAHMVGVPEDILEGRMDGVGSDAWTQAQVDRHVDDTLSDLVATWISIGERFDPLIPAFPVKASGQMLMDVVTHEHDLRDALGRPGGEESPAVSLALDWLCTNMPFPPAVLDGVTESGCAPFVAVRALSGRLSIAEMDRHGLPGARIADAFAGTPFSAPQA